jgi:23S rRNA (adenine2503-C2)-methyltransferase
LATQITNLYDLTRESLAKFIVSRGGHAVHTARLWSYLYRERVHVIEAMHDLPTRLRTRLVDDACLTSLSPATETHSSDGLTRKYLLELHDGHRIETVLMRFRGRVTACLSSQVGCALGCVFCATGQMGFSRNLSTGEIVVQALHVARELCRVARGTNPIDQQRQQNESLRNLVMMGMGEPLLNYDAVMDALDILRDHGGFSIGTKQITLSTVGVVPGILRLADEGRPYSLAVSLHAATQQERAAMVPAARTWPLDVLMEACRYYSNKLNRKIFFEWTLIEGKNDSAEQAQALVELLREMPAQVNLIPLNPTAGYSGIPGRSEAALRFQAILREGRVPCTVRQRRGIDIAAGCGQLAVAEESDARPTSNVILSS